MLLLRFPNHYLGYASTTILIRIYRISMTSTRGDIHFHTSADQQTGRRRISGPIAAHAQPGVSGCNPWTPR
jgi:hypothetical protein